MYPHSFLWHYLWIAPRALQFVIAIVMIRRKLFRDFPMFFVYIVFEVVQGGALFVLDHSPAVSAYQYWYAHWVGSLISMTWRFCVIWEIFCTVVSGYPGLEKLTRIIFRWAVVFLLLAIAVAARAKGDGSLHLHSRIHVLDLSVDVMQSGLWLVLLGFSSYLRLSWRSFAYGIAFGMGIFSTVDLAIEGMRVWGGFVAGYAFDFVAMATYHCCVMMWMAYLWIPETSRQIVQDLPENDVEQWNAELQRLLLQ